MNKLSRISLTPKPITDLRVPVVRLTRITANGDIRPTVERTQLAEASSAGSTEKTMTKKSKSKSAVNRKKNEKIAVQIEQEPVTFKWDWEIVGK